MKYRICQCCVMDTSDPDIRFFGNNGCSNCRDATMLYKKTKKESNNLKEVVYKIRKAGRGKKYDCIIGLSGGVDSTYVAYLVKKLHLRPLAVHFDNGWNSELAVKNIQNILAKLNIDLYTYVVDWNEFKDLQLAFLKASTPDSEIPTDHAIMAILYKIALKNNVKYIIDGWNVQTETVLPIKWSYGHGDWKYIKNINEKFGKTKMKTFPHYTKEQMWFYEKIMKIERIHILNYVSYDKQKVKKLIKNKLGWRDYGDKHGESVYTKFYQNYILPEKFGYDKRRMHLSSLIVSKQISREDALRILEQPLYTEIDKKRDLEYFCNKMEISQSEFQDIMKLPKKTYWDYCD